MITNLKQHLFITNRRAKTTVLEILDQVLNQYYFLGILLHARIPIRTSIDSFTNSKSSLSRYQQACFKTKNEHIFQRCLSLFSYLAQADQR